MSTGSFEHYRNNGGHVVVRPITTKPVAQRITPPTARTKYKGEGICLGAWVEYQGYAYRGNFGCGDLIHVPSGVGQVWSEVQGGADPIWWIATDQGFHRIAASRMTLLGQSSEDVPLFEVSA